MQAHENRQGRLITIICVLLIVLQVGLISNIIFDNTPYSFVQKVIYNMSIIVLLIQTLIFVQHGLVKYAGSLFLFGFIAEIFGSAGIIYGERQALVPFMYVLSVLIASLLVRWWVGLALVPILAPFGTAMQILGLAPGVPQWTTINIYIVYLGVIAALAALYAQSLESALSKLETESAAREHEVAERARAEAYAAQAADLAAARERNRIAREIHDGLGHYFTGIGAQLQATQALLDIKRDRAITALGKAQRLADEGLDEVRRSISTLRENPLSTRSLRDALAHVLDTTKAAGLTTQLDIYGTARHLHDDVALTLYRIAQEAISNTLKHAQSQSIHVMLDYRPANYIALTVSDDGQGAETMEGGFGLIGMRERIEILGGTMQVHMAPGQGCTINVEVPA